MAITSAEELAEHVLQHELLTERQLREVWAELGTRDVPLQTLRQFLLSRDLLTFYQIEHLMLGDRPSFFYGDYKVLYLVGTGTYARVYRAVHRSTDRQVAVKVLRKRYCGDSVQTERFCKEGTIGSTLRHPNIVPIYEVFSKGRDHYLVIEFVEGQNLREFIKVRKIFAPLDATKLMWDVAKGLEYAYQQGVTHRDMKLSNILVSSRGEAKLVDFGLAAADGLASDDQIADHPNPRAIDYTGLERATGVRRDDSRSDIFFVGCMYYHMLTGQSPLAETRDRTQRLSKTRFQAIPPIQRVNPNMPTGVAMVVSKAMAFDPEQRYQTPSQLEQDLHALLQRKGVLKASQAKAPPPTESGPPDAKEGHDDRGQSRTVMIVEGDVHMQNVFREQLKRKGYRVLVISDPQRAVDRFSSGERASDVVVFGTSVIGAAALEAFNQFGLGKATAGIPAILLLDERHSEWKKDAEVDAHRVVEVMPLTLRRLRALLIHVLTADNAAEQL